MILFFCYVISKLRLSKKPHNLIFFFCVFFSGKIHYTEVFDMLCAIDPPLGFGKKCPERQAYKKLIRMNMPMDKEGKVGILHLFNMNFM